MAITFNPTTFRARYSEFSDAAIYTDDYLNEVYNDALCYISDEDLCVFISENCRSRSLNLMVAHILKIEDELNNGGEANFATSASIGDVSVSVQPPPQSSQFSWWLSLTGYGKNILGLFSAATAGGFYFGGRRERGSFRKSGGGF